MTFTDSTVVQSSVRPLNCEPVTFSIPTDPILKTLNICMEWLPTILKFLMNKNKITFAPSQGIVEIYKRIQMII